MEKIGIAILIFIMSGCSSLRGNVEYQNPSEDYIRIQGEIDESLTYLLKVQYVTRADSNKCKNYNWMADLYVPQSIKYEYHPTIEDGTHWAHIPLKELDPGTKCKWEPNIVYLCVDRVGKTPTMCRSLFFLRGDNDNNDEINIECNDFKYCLREPSSLHTADIDVFNRGYEVNILEKEN